MVTRTLALWVPDWPVVAARRRGAAPEREPVAVLEHGRVLAASREARDEDVGAGLRRREAEARCPGITVVEIDPGADARGFEPVARAVERLTPRLVIDRPGVLAFPTRGPSRYFGGDDGLVTRVLAALAPEGIEDARAGIADGSFAARLAARRGIVVPPGETPAFLASWPVGVLGDEALAGGLCRLGLRTRGAFAELPSPAVLARFGPEGIGAHRLARGEEEHPPSLTVPPPDLVEVCELDPPAERVDEAAFAAKGLADRLLARLEERGLACTQVVVEAETEHGEHLARSWRHEGALTPAALTERVRWQLDGWITGGLGERAAEGGHLTGGLTLLRLTPDQVIPARGRQLGFWGGDAVAVDRASRVFARVKGLLGLEHVVTPVPQGGRTPAERVHWVPWGDPREPEPGRPVDSAWPGVVPGPAPARVLEPPPPAELLDEHGRPVTVTSRGEASGMPAVLHCGALPGHGGEITAWAGPWAQDVRWWDRRGRARRVHWQVAIGEIACLVRVERGTATLDALYD
ncbi:MAG: DNA polymerase Y family protein [Acidimicrobiia bacterium]